MSVDNFDGDGTADQPSIIYAFDNGDEIREVSRSGYGEVGPSPGDVIKRNSTRSNPTEPLPELELPGGRGLKEEDCGEEIPVFACSHCGKPKYLGRCCASPVCKRDWPAAVKNKAVRLAGKLDAMRRKLYAQHDGKKDVDFNHVVASLPGFLVDSKEPVNRALLVLKTLLEQNWHISGFAAIYHPYRIKKEYRKDQYEHDGEEGEGDMTWADVLSSENPEEYVKYSPHFHLFFPAIRTSFDYMVAEAVQEQSGWVFHRITKDGNSNISVENLEDLVYQVTYAFSHAGVNDWSTGRFELTSRMKGELHNMSVSDEVEAECLSFFCEAAPKLLGTPFADLSKSSCDAEVPQRNSTEKKEDPEIDEQSTNEPTSNNVARETDESETLKSKSLDNDSGSVQEQDSADFSESNHTESPPVEDSESQASLGKSAATDSSTKAASQHTQSDSGSSQDTNSGSDTMEPPFVDRRSECGGELVPIREAAELLDDLMWCATSPYVSELRTAVREWSRRTNGDEHLAWVMEEEGRSPAVVQLR